MTDADDRRCATCHQLIQKPGDHDPAYHVAMAFHGPTRGLHPRCISCDKTWPCPTYIKFSYPPEFVVEFLTIDI